MSETTNLVKRFETGGMRTEFGKECHRYHAEDTVVLRKFTAYE